MLLCLKLRDLGDASPFIVEEEEVLRSAGGGGDRSVEEVVVVVDSFAAILREIGEIFEMEEID